MSQKRTEANTGEIKAKFDAITTGEIIPAEIAHLSKVAQRNWWLTKGRICTNAANSLKEDIEKDKCEQKLSKLSAEAISMLKDAAGDMMKAKQMAKDEKQRKREAEKDEKKRKKQEQPDARCAKSQRKDAGIPTTRATNQTTLKISSPSSTSASSKVVTLKWKVLKSNV